MAQEQLSDEYHRKVNDINTREQSALLLVYERRKQQIAQYNMPEQTYYEQMIAWWYNE
jgi:hypothetical protein